MGMEKMASLVILLFLLRVALGNHLEHEGVIHIQNLGEYKEILDKDGNFQVYWSIEEDEKSVTFDIVGNTTGFVGFGITLDGTLKNADIFIGGVRKSVRNTETTYSGDYHGSSEGDLILDAKSNWALVDAQENATHTYIRVSRLLDTCDNEDLPIRETGTTRMFWIVGNDDWDITKWEAHGSKFTNVYPLPYPDVDISGFKVWEITTENVFPDKVSAHWCIIREGPKADKLLTIAGYEAILSSEAAGYNSLHITLKICVPPPGVSAKKLFGPYINGDGADCHNNNGTLPSQYCHTGLISRLVGAKRVLLPEHVGTSFQNNAYYNLELHYKNPEQIKFKSGLRIFYTEKPRKYEAHRFVVTTNPLKQALMIPPNQNKFTVISHFPPQCVAQGFKIFNVLLHAHHAGRSLRLRHFRDGEELPIILYDENYSAFYQQNRHLKNEVEVLPGDHLVMECEMASGSKAIIHEMCVSHIYAYSEVKPKYILASSWVDVDKQMHLLGIKKYNITFDGEHMNTQISEPKKLAGELGHIVSHHIKWTPQLLRKFQDLYLYGKAHLTCTDGKVLPTKAKDTVKLPLAGIVHPYVKPDICST